MRFSLLTALTATVSLISAAITDGNYRIKNSQYGTYLTANINNQVTVNERYPLTLSTFFPNPTNNST